MTFVKGAPRPPNGGRRKGTPNKGTVRAKRLIAEGADKAIIDKIVADARDGDRAAQALYLRHLRVPMPRTPALNPTPIDVEAPQTIEETRALAARLAVDITSCPVGH
jgi:hypothetical protein